MSSNSEHQLERNKLIIQAFVEAINAQNWQELDELVAPDFVRHSEAGGQPGVQGRRDLMSFLRGEYQIFPDAHETIEDMIVEGDKVRCAISSGGPNKEQWGYIRRREKL